MFYCRQRECDHTSFPGMRVKDERVHNMFYVVHNGQTLLLPSNPENLWLVVKPVWWMETLHFATKRQAASARHISRRQQCTLCSYCVSYRPLWITIETTHSHCWGLFLGLIWTSHVQTPLKVIVSKAVRGSADSLSKAKRSPVWCHQWPGACLFRRHGFQPETLLAFFFRLTGQKLIQICIFRAAAGPETTWNHERFLYWKMDCLHIRHLQLCSSIRNTWEIQLASLVEAIQVV